MQLIKTQRTTVTRNAERASYDSDLLKKIIDKAK